MKKVGKTILAGFIILIIGAIIMLVALGLNGWTIKDNYEMKEFTANSGINSVSLDIDISNIKIQFYDGDTIKVEYPESKNLITTFNQETAGKIAIITENKRKIFNFGSWLKKIPQTTISLPKNISFNFNSEINAGSIDFASGDYGEFALKLNAGNVTCGEIKCGKSEFNINAGNVYLQKLNSQNIKINLNAGNFTINAIQTDLIDCKVNAGNINLNQVLSSKVNLEVNAGNIFVDNITSDDITLDVDAGKITLSVIGNKADYNITSSVDGGSCNVSSQVGQNPLKNIKIDINGGKVEMQFK